jgi:hypothetical protein
VLFGPRTDAMPGPGGGVEPVEWGTPFARLASQAQREIFAQLVAARGG